MILLAYLFIASLTMFVVFMATALIVENNFDESHPIKKWWRRNVVANYSEKNQDGE